MNEQPLNYSLLLKVFLAGLVLPLSFAPFHLPGMAILSLAFLYAKLIDKNNHSPFLCGLFFGLGYFGLGVSWIYVSVHEYGHLSELLAALITLFFLLYLSLFTAIFAFFFKQLNKRPGVIYSCFLFAALWMLSEYLRSTLFSGFPWLLIGFGQFDAPTKYLLPLIGVFGLGCLTSFLAGLLATGIKAQGLKRYLIFIVIVFLIMLPSALKYKQWSKEKDSPISVGIIQANLSMRDKWDERLFWQLLLQYKKNTEKLLGTELIVMPESAIPLPPVYVEDFLASIHQKAKEAGSAVLLGIPKPSLTAAETYSNALISLGQAKGFYLKQHLVPFGEYTPKPMKKLGALLSLPDTNLLPGTNHQPLVTVKQHAIATLICYELAYGDLLRQQLPQAEWIVSISDDGWFGHSLALYQQLQMAQVRSLETQRYQVVANNDGLSSVINRQGEVLASLPAFHPGLLRASLVPATGITPWVRLGDRPILLFCSLLVLLFTLNRIFTAPWFRHYVIKNTRLEQ